MKILVAIPVVNNVPVTTECLDSLIIHPVDIVLCDNGADQDIKDLFAKYARDNANIIQIFENAENQGVNPVWNMFIAYFLANPEYTHLVILNSDVIMNSEWLHVIKGAINIHGEHSWLATETDKVNIFRKPSISFEYTDIQGGVPGIFIWLTREHAELIYPIPPQIKIWFGDNWLLDLGRLCGIKTLMLKKLWIFHHGSETIKRVKGVTEWIEEDKKNWKLFVEPEMRKRAEKYNTK